MRLISLCLLGLLHCSLAWSIEPELTLGQLNHRAYTAAEGAPSKVDAIAQTTDGTLWLGSSEGLSRFDGMRFVRYPGPGEDPLPSIGVRALIASSDGGLWIGFALGGVGFLKAGHLTEFSYQLRSGLPGGSVKQFAWDRSGALWVATTLGLARLRGTEWERVEGDSIARADAVVVDRAGTVWVATGERVLMRAIGETRFREVATLKVAFNNDPYLETSPDGTVWAIVSGAAIRLDAAGNSQPGVGRTGIASVASAPLFDAAGNLWLNRWDRIQRLSRRDLTANPKLDTAPHIEEFGYADGLSGPVEGLFLDRENNIWVSTDTGLDRFSHSNVVRLSLPYCPGIGYALAADKAGSLWAACPRMDSPRGSVTQIRDGSVVSQQDSDKFTAGYGDADGTVWFAGPEAIGHLVSGRIETVPLPQEARGVDIQAIARDRSGALWLDASHWKGVFRFFDGKWSRPLEDAPLVETADDQGAMWFGYPKNRIARLQGGTVRILDAADGLHVGAVMAMLTQGKQLWVGGDHGLARFDGTRFVPIVSAAGNAFTGISGIVATANGDLWLNAIGGIARIPHQEAARVIHDPTYRVRTETFEGLDGVPGAPFQLRPIPSAVATTDGRVWFATTAGIVSIDPAHIVHNTLPPPVTIWSISSREKRYPNVGAELRLPIHTTDLQIDYSAGSLTVPERVNFRYKLEGFDREWRDAGNRREALYTNLGPGRYTFRVTASNNDGVWNNTGASIDFTLKPAFYQTKWFDMLCALLALGLVVVLYKIRMRQVSSQVRAQLGARLAERERIARELHDTLLQGVQGLIWRFQAVADRISRLEPARQLMEQALDRADQLLGESRDRVKDLRALSPGALDLAQALAAEGEHLAQEHPARFHTRVEGTTRELHPIAREETLLIAREALGNAFRHAGAQHIEVEVSHGDAELHVRIRDDGRGIDGAVLQAGGKPGHFGLLGMRERAMKLRAHVYVWSKPGAGTEVDLRVPADVAYVPMQSARRRTRWWREIFSSSSARH